MSERPSTLPTLALLGIGLLTGALAVNLIPSMPVVVLLATLVSGAALAPMVAGAPDADWAGRLVTRLSEGLSNTWQSFRITSEQDTRKRVFSTLVGLNLAVFGAIFLQAGA